MKRLSWPSVAVAILSFATAASAQLIQKATLSLDLARTMADAAEQEARRQAATVVIAVVDDGGHLILLERLDDTQVASVEVSIAKARTAAIFRRPSREFEEQIAKGRLASLVLPGASPLQGGLPVMLDGHCLGAIGVSGNTPAQDEQIAMAGVRAAEAMLGGSASALGPHAIAPVAVPLDIRPMDDAIAGVIGPDATVERIAEGFHFTEGPVWTGTALLFSDPNANRIYRWTSGGPTGGLAVFREHSGYEGADVSRYAQPGSNGLTIDPQGRLIICEHGNRRVTRLERDGSTTVLAARYDGKRLNSPNDVVCRSDGSVYFTDPPFGLPGFEDDPDKELPYSGVYRVTGRLVHLLTAELNGPNGIAFSPDEQWLYVGDWDPQHKVVMRYPVYTDGSTGAGSVLIDLTDEPGDDAIDGLEVDGRGNLFVTGPGGLWVVARDGTPLGLVTIGGEAPHNLAWGDGGSTLYIAAQTGLYRLGPIATGPARSLDPR